MKNTVYMPYEKSVVINEHKAPTDKSIELLNEFEEKARNNIIYKAKIDTNFMKAIAIYYRDEISSDTVSFHVKFRLNDKEVIIRDSIDKFEWSEELSQLYFGFGNVDIFMIVCKKLSEMIAIDLMNQSPEFLKRVKNLR